MVSAGKRRSNMSSVSAACPQLVTHHQQHHRNVSTDEVSSKYWTLHLL